MTPPTVTADSPAPPRAVERPVFAATTSTRPRALRLAGRTAAGLVGLWLVALVLGAFGFGHVPGIQLPRILGDDGGSHPAVRTIPAVTARQASAGGATLGRHHGTAAPATGGRLARRRAVHRGRSSGGTGAGGGTRGGAHRGAQTRTPSQGGAGAPGPAAATTSQPAATGSPATTTSPPNSNSGHSHATPRGSSSSSPGSRSQAGTAPGREHSAASPTPGQGRAEHKPPKG